MPQACARSDGCTKGAVVAVLRLPLRGVRNDGDGCRVVVGKFGRPHERHLRAARAGDGRDLLVVG
jgi:hypothetical protein